MTKDVLTNNMTTLSEEIIESGNNRAEKALTLYKEFLGETNIEKCKEEDFVIKQLVLGKSDSDIRKELKEKHPQYSFTKDDFEKFLVRNDEVVKYLETRSNVTARRHIQAKTQVEEHLANLLLWSEKLVVDSYNRGENANSISAIRAATDILTKVAKVMGYSVDEEETKVTNVFNVVSDKYASELKGRMHNANFRAVDADFEEVKK